MSSKIEIKLPCRTSGRLFPEIVCKDGFQMSVQASDFHYSKPSTAENHMLALYEKVEVGYPNQPEELLTHYESGEGSNVFGYVPMEVVRKIIRKHGGTL